MPYHTVTMIELTCIGSSSADPVVVGKDAKVRVPGSCGCDDEFGTGRRQLRSVEKPAVRAEYFLQGLFEYVCLVPAIRKPPRQELVDPATYGLARG